MRNWRFLVAIALTSASCVLAQGLGAPTLGALFDRATGQIRPVFGIPGSARVGLPLSIDPLLRATVCGDIVVGSTQVEQRAELISFSGGKPVRTALEVDAAPDGIILSPGCSAAAFLYNGRREAVLVSGLPDARKITHIDISSLSSLPNAVAVDDAGSMLVAAVSDGTNSIMQRLNGHTGPQLIASVGPGAAFSFLRRSKELLIADRGTNQLLRYELTETPSLHSTYSADLHDAVAIGVSAQNRHALVGGAHSVIVFDLISGTTKSIPCGCDVTGVQPLGSGSAFQLTEATGRPIALLTVSGEQANASLLPVGRKN